MKIVYYPSKNCYKRGVNLIQNQQSFIIEINTSFYKKIFALSLPYIIGEKSNTPFWIIILEFIYFLKLDTLVGNAYISKEYNISYQPNRILFEYIQVKGTSENN